MKDPTASSSSPATRALRILVCCQDGELSERVARDLGGDVDVVTVWGEPETVGALSAGEFDACLVGLVGEDARGTLVAAEREAPDVPIIAVLRCDDTTAEEQAFRAGAAEVLVLGAGPLPQPFVKEALRQTVRRHAGLASERRRVRRLQGLHDVGRAMWTPSIDGALEEAVASILHLFGADRAYLLHPCDTVSSEVRIVAEQSRPEYPGSFSRGAPFEADEKLRGLLSAALDTGKPVAWSAPASPAGWPVEYATRSQLAVSLRPAAGEPWLLGLHRCRPGKAWTPEDADLLAEIALRVAASIDSHRLTSNLADAFKALSNLLMRPLDERRLLQDALDTLRALLQARYAAIGIVDARSGKISEFIVSGITPEEASRIGPPPTGRGLLGVPIREGHALRLKDMSTDPRSAGFPENHPRMTSLLAVPIPPGIGFRGIFYISDKLSADAFSASDEALASTFAGALAFILAKRQEERRRREAMERLAASEERFRTMVEHAPDVIFTCDLEGRLLSVSSSVKRILGFEVAELLGRPFAELGGKDRQHAIPVPEFGDAEMLGMEIRAKDGRSVLMEVNVWRLREGQRTVGLQGIARDVTERKRLEDQYFQVQKLEPIGRLAAGLAHDFRNMLMAVSAHAELARESLPEGHAAAAELAGIESAVAKAAVLARQLLSLARKQPVNRRVVPLEELVRSTQRLLRPVIGEGIEVTLRLESGVAPVFADPVQLEQVLVNLGLNARDAMPAGGTLRIEVARAFVAGAERPGLSPGEYARLSMVDTGCGMSNEVKAHIFEPFFSTKGPDKGSGLGLATSYGIVRQLGGLIQVTSEEGAGARFDIYLPAAKPEYAESTPSDTVQH